MHEHSQPATTYEAINFGLASLARTSAVTQDQSTAEDTMK